MEIAPSLASDAYLRWMLLVFFKVERKVKRTYFYAWLRVTGPQ
jgi:hypothetical protein